MVNPDRVAFTLFGKDIYWYGVLMAVGIIIAVMLAMSEGKRKKLPKDTIIDLCLVAIPCGIVGARLYYVLFELKQYLADPIRILYVWEGGLAIYGAVIGGLLGILIYGRAKKLRFLTLSDCIAPGLVLAQAIGRWGNFFNQEAFGNPVTNPDLWWFPLSVRIDVPHTFNGFVDGQLVSGACQNPYHLATFFYESLWCVLIFLFLWFFLRKRAKHDGDVFLWYVLLYGFERALVEGLRGDSLWLIRPGTLSFLNGGVRVSQLISFLLFAGVLIFFLVRRAQEKKLQRLIWPAPLAAAEETEAEAPVLAESEAADGAEAPAETASPDEIASSDETVSSDETASSDGSAADSETRED